MTITADTRALDRINAQAVVIGRLAEMGVYTTQLGYAYGWESDEHLEAKRSLEHIRKMLLDENGQVVKGVTSAHKEDDLNIILGYHGMTVGIIGHRKHNRCVSDCGYYTYHARKDRFTGERIDPSAYHFGSAPRSPEEGHVHSWERDPEDPQPVSWSAHS